MLYITKFFRYLATIALTISITGCMMTPYDEYTVSSRAEVIPFLGAVLNGGEPVTIEAVNNFTGHFEAVATTESETAVAWIADGQELHRWQVDLALPSEYWIPGLVGYSARIRVAAYGFHLITLDDDWYSCLLENPGLADFARACASENSPEIMIKTADYMPKVRTEWGPRP